ncbi:MAG: dihydroorotase [Oscillospiraceae bacterium]|jgi:dihydroorotase|nr:dihydroorotase [Oscillospiraceae bacterium]
MAELITAPGLVDMHVHFRDPGFTHKEDIISGAASAAAGGVTTAVCMPNTSPVLDTPELVRYVLDVAKNAKIRVLPYAAVSVGQAGRELTDFAALKLAGAAALSDDGNPIMSAELMRRALFAARDCDMVISTHCEDAELVRNFAVNEGKISKLLEIPGRPAIAEELMIARDALLARETGAHVHIAHVSTARSVEIIRRAKNDGISITCETCPQYFTLTEDEVPSRGALARVNPPLRTEADRLAIIGGLRDGTIDVIATDHAPHSAEEKSRGLEDSPSGMVGLETSLALTLTALYHTGLLTLDEISAKMSLNPAKILKLDLSDDYVVFDPDEKWTVEPALFKSKSRNTPFGGRELRGRVKRTISRGKIVYGGAEDVL